MDSNIILKTGHFQADGDAYDLDLGGVPIYAEIWNHAAADTEIMGCKWWKDMGDGAGFCFYVDADGDVGSVQYKSSGAPIAVKDTVSVQTSEPIKTTKVQGITIAAGFMDDDDEIYYMALVHGSEDQDLGDIA